MSAFDNEMGRARRRVADFDKADGFADRSLHTVRCALEAGLRHPETGAQFDALIMLEDLHRCIRAEVQHEIARLGLHTGRKAANNGN